MPDHSTSISEPEQAELYAPQCTTKLAAATFTSNEARESFSKSQNEIKTAGKKFKFFIKFRVSAIILISTFLCLLRLDSQIKIYKKPFVYDYFPRKVSFQLVANQVNSYRLTYREYSIFLPSKIKVFSRSFNTVPNGQNT